MSKRTSVLWKKILGVTLGVGAVIGVLYIYWKTDVFTVHRYDIVGVPEEVLPQLEQDIRKLSETPFLKIIPTNKLFTYRGKEMKQLVLERLPNTKSVVVRAVPLHTLRVTVVPYDPLFRLPAGKAITKDGTIYTEVHDISHLPLFAASSTLSLEAVELDRQKIEVIGATSTAFLFAAIADIIPKIDTVLFPVGFVEVNEHGDVLLSENVGGRSVKLSSSVDMEKQWSNVISAIDTNPLKGLLETKPKDLLYIDVRFGNKVFYKFTKDSVPDSIEEHASSTSQ